MKALIVNGRIAQVTENTFPVHENFKWVDCPEDCSPDWSYEDGTFTPPSPPQKDYRQKRRAEYQDVGDTLDAILKQLNHDRLNGRELIQEADDVLNHWLAVKAKHPKAEK